ncbi:MAG: hypothetical protein AB7G15_16120 [Alphaproteobacteria bacterium]
MKPLKAIVILMGVMIVALFIVIAVTVYNRMSGPSKPAATANPTLAVPGSIPEPARLGLPPGSEIKTMTLSGQTLVLHVAVPDQGQMLYVIQLPEAVVVQRINVTPK